MVKIAFSPKDTGACSLCIKHNNCNIQRAIKESVHNIKNNNDTPMEFVIYTCPNFEETI